MKFNSLAILLILSSCALFAGEKLKFHSPDLKDPHFKLIFQFEIQQDSTIIEQISLNSKKLDNFIILKDGKKQSLLLQKDKYDFLIDYAWENGQKYKITLFLTIHKFNSRVILKSLFDKKVFPCYLSTRNVIYFNHYPVIRLKSTPHK